MIKFDGWLWCLKLFWASKGQIKVDSPLKSVQHSVYSNREIWESIPKQCWFKHLNVVLKIQSESCSVMSDSTTPWTIHSPWNSPGQNTGAGSHSLLQGVFPTQGSNPLKIPSMRIKSALKADSLPAEVDSLPAEPPWKPKNTGVGSLSLLQGIFPTQGSNPDLLHCGQILYHLSH